MVSFDCKKCNYSTKYKYDFNKHLKTKKHRVNEISIPKNENTNDKNIQKHPQNIQKHPDIYNVKMKFKWAFCKYFWEAHVHGGNISLEMLEVWNRKFNDLKITVG